MAAILRFETVGARVAGAAEILSDLDFGLDAGEVAFVAGARGAGKTMLADLAGLRRRPDRGRIRFLGRDVGEAPPGEVARLRRRIGHAAEAPAMLLGLSPAENVALPLRLAGVGSKTALEDAAELLRWLGSADPLTPGRKPLGPLERARTALARALVHRPALAVLDEPFRALDARTGERLSMLVDRLSGDGTAILVSGSEEEAALMPAGTTRLRLAEGRLVVVDRPRERPFERSGR